jgi:hypothetical protein
MVKKARIQAEMTAPVDCACVIHGNAYDWIYVDKLRSMLVRNFSRPVNLHVWTEAHRSVPAPFIKHDLYEWPGISGPRKSWWYKIQMFNSNYFQGRLIYFDLDTIIVRNIDWLINLDADYLWAPRDFRHHWKGQWSGINSSVMVWNTTKFDWIWRNFNQNNITSTVKRFPGDQDYLTNVLDNTNRRYMDADMIKSWRWQIKDGGMNFKTRQYKRPDAGSILDPLTSIIIFHGQPKPHEIQEPFIQQHWG